MYVLALKCIWIHIQPFMYHQRRRFYGATPLCVNSAMSYVWKFCFINVCSDFQSVVSQLFIYKRKTDYKTSSLARPADFSKIFGRKNAVVTQSNGEFMDIKRTSRNVLIVKRISAKKKFNPIWKCSLYLSVCHYVKCRWESSGYDCLMIRLIYRQIADWTGSWHRSMGHQQSFLVGGIDPFSTFCPIQGFHFIALKWWPHKYNNILIND